MIDKLNFAKTGVKLVVGKSVNFVVATAITRYIPVESKTEQVQLFIGSYAIAGVVSTLATDYVGGKVDDIVESVTKIKSIFDTPEE